VVHVDSLDATRVDNPGEIRIEVVGEWLCLLPRVDSQRARVPECPSD